MNDDTTTESLPKWLCHEDVWNEKENQEQVESLCTNFYDDPHYVAKASFKAGWTLALERHARLDQTPPGPVTLTASKESLPQVSDRQLVEWAHEAYDYLHRCVDQLPDHHLFQIEGIRTVLETYPFEHDSTPDSPKVDKLMAESVTKNPAMEKALMDMAIKGQGLVLVIDPKEVEKKDQRIAELEALVDRCRDENMKQVNWNIDKGRELSALMKERDALKAENARLRAELDS